MKKYNTVSGDVWDWVAYKKLGNCLHMEKLINANRELVSTFVIPQRSRSCRRGGDNMSVQARYVHAKIKIAGKDVTRDLAPYLQSITYEDVESGETDTIEIELDDRNRIFLSDWFPQRGDTLEVELIREYWQGKAETETLPLGLFEVDEITNSYPPNVTKIKGNSCPQNSALRQVDESKAWENVKLSEIVSDVAKTAGVELVFEATDDPTIKRAEQAEPCP